MISSPSSTKYIKELAKIILEPVKRGESALVRWFPGHGKTVLLSHIFTNKTLLKENLGSFYERFLFVRIDGYLFFLQNLTDFFTNVLKTLSEELDLRGVKTDKRILKSNISHSLILTIKTIINLCKIATDHNSEVIFVIDAIDEFSQANLKEMFSCWEYIIESNRTRIHTHININKRDIIDQCVKQSGLMQNIIFIPLPEREECKYFISFYAKLWKLQLDEKIIENIFKFCGHDTVLVKEALRICNKKDAEPIDFSSEPTLLLKAKNDYEQLGIKEKEVIESKLNSNIIDLNSKKIAQELVYANFWDKNYHIPQLFAQSIIDNKNIKNLVLDSKKGKLFFGDIDLSKKLWGSEYNILLLLFKRKGRIVSRDEIAERLWGNKMLDLYSDWAIDKAVSRLRTKLTALSFSYQISTRKKEGFILEI